jgi:hypothetical protein
MQRTRSPSGPDDSTRAVPASTRTNAGRSATAARGISDYGAIDRLLGGLAPLLGREDDAIPTLKTPSGSTKRSAARSGAPARSSSWRRLSDRQLVSTASKARSAGRRCRASPGIACTSPPPTVAACSSTAARACTPSRFGRRGPSVRRSRVSPITRSLAGSDRPQREIRGHQSRRERGEGEPTEDRR